MRELRASLIGLFQNAWKHNASLSKQMKAKIVTTATQLLTTNADALYGVEYCLLSHGWTHRYIVVVHCPDQAFYPDAIRTYLQKEKVSLIEQQSILFSRGAKDLGHVQAPLSDSKHKALLLVLHLSATTTEHIDHITQDIQHILQAVHHSVEDFPSMRGELEMVATKLIGDAPDAAALLHWMLDDHYLLLGLIYPQHMRKNRGISRSKKLLAQLTLGFEEDLQQVSDAQQPGLQWLHLVSSFRHLYGATNIKTVRICWREEEELHTVILIGHFSRAARYINASTLPYLQQHWLELSGDSPLQQSAFYMREVRMLFDRAPKALLMAIPMTQWMKPFKAIVDMNTPTQVMIERLSPVLGNVEYLMVAVENQRFGNNILTHMKVALQRLSFQVLGTEHYAVGSTHLVFIAVEIDGWPHINTVHDAIRQCVVFWKDKARYALLEAGLPSALMHESLLELSQLSNLYQDQFPPAQFVSDVLIREEVKQDGKTKVRLTLQQNEQQNMIEVHVLAKKPMPLAIMTDQLNAFALVTMTQALVPLSHGEHQIHICRFHCQAPDMLHMEGLTRLCQGIQDVFNHLADHDALNALVVYSGLSIREVMALITLRNHLAQLMPEVSTAALSEVMLKQHQVSLYLFRMFESKHRPSMPMTYLEQVTAQFNQAMLDVQNLKEDTWLRALADMVLASVRTNAWIRERGQALAIKLDSSQVDFVPEPKPYREIFVHGVCVEGVHLRAGAIARGGLRFSDRPTDFRTEVLELMATQVVKNGQIVPTGAKGGFVVRGGEGSDFVLAQYHQFIRALLSITDNRVKNKLMPPAGIKVAEEDEADSYLVVAADKGTARFSDDANEEALAVDFWLGDAFASGGSYGYDHKAFGITARGAWVCLAHHFDKLGINLWQDEVTVVGIGDMGGDVFGNGMLLNPHIKLLAAFNHLHVFLDPNPNVQQAFAERQRLFDAVKGWGDYNSSLISEGGGVFLRAAKNIKLSVATQAALGLKIDACSGEALVRAMLQAPVDLLYNGGIGTYIKASSETDADAQDPANNAVRVDANSLRCKVLGEGGNLGLTQAARIEYVQRGGLMNTDAIDNAAGVNMSDHEVNLKILLVQEPFVRRNMLLKRVANAVAEQCLNDNKEQAIALSLAEVAAKQHAPRLLHLQTSLLAEGYVSSYDADNFSLRPVISEWLGHEKNRVHQALDGENFHAKSVFGETFLRSYFPHALHKQFMKHIVGHALASDISHTRITSYLLNHYGLVSIHYLQNLTSLPIPNIVQALLVADALLDIRKQYEILVMQSGNLEAWYNIQQHVLNVAQGLLTFHHLDTVDEQWLKATRKVLRPYETKEIATLITALPLAEQTGKSLHLSLKATAACLQVLPFSDLEAALRTPLWTSDDAHALRCEWLMRLMLLKLQAAKVFIQGTPKHQAMVLNGWETHPLQSALILLCQADAERSPEEQRLRYVLALTHLQSIVETSAD